MNHSTYDLLEYSSVLPWVAGIIAYGVYQYFQRERVHRELLQEIVSGASTPPGREIKSGFWQLLSVAAIVMLLVGGIIWLCIAASGILYAREVAYGIAFFFVILLGFLFPVLIRQIRAYQNLKNR
jgi:hypothetical protein